MTLEEIVKQAGGKFPIETTVDFFPGIAYIIGKDSFDSGSFVIQYSDGTLASEQGSEERFSLPPKKKEKKQLWLHVYRGVAGAIFVSADWKTDEAAKQHYWSSYIGRDPNCLIPLEVDDE
jgi:hypothetical protein